MNVIGIDCATQETKTGLALGSVADGKVIVSDVTVGSKRKPTVAVVSEWLQTGQTTLLAFDAPLGWPTALGEELHNHVAGTPLDAEPDTMFSRMTDHNIECQLKKRPLEVGADRIARTAHRALRLLGELRKTTEMPIPLAWEMGLGQETSVIEVYPAATLIAMGIPVESYKKSDACKERGKLIWNLQKHVAISASQKQAMERSADALDAVICVLAGYDFIMGRCLPPENMDLAKREGWIWVRPRQVD